MKILKKIRDYFNCVQNCYICGKVISPDKNRKSVKITMGYSRDELLYYKLSDLYFIIKSEFYLCEKHREILEQFILDLQFKEVEKRTGKKIEKPINNIVDVSLSSFLENGIKADFNITKINQWGYSNKRKKCSVCEGVGYLYSKLKNRVKCSFCKGVGYENE